MIPRVSRPNISVTIITTITYLLLVLWKIIIRANFINSSSVLQNEMIEVSIVTIKHEKCL